MKKLSEMITQITKGLFAGDAAFFFGAGASASAGAPLWTKLRDALMKEAFSEIVTEEKQLEEFKKKFKIADNIEILKYPEVIFSMARAVFGVGYLEKFLGAYYRKIVPNSDTYNVMENLVRWGFIRDVFTTNQDALFEKKFDQSGVPYIKIIPRFCDEKDKEKSSDVKIHSLHGDWKTHGSILSDIQQIIPFKGAADVYNNYEIFKVEKTLFSYKTLVVMGYGGLDCDIQFLFGKYLKRGRIIWLCHGGDVPEIGDDLKSGIDFVNIVDSDNFFDEVERKIIKDKKHS
ncbi:MAG TPA: SIR2 family protein, partial [bacterium]|nr:SIR2 family protein [bacterium]